MNVTGPFALGSHSLPRWIHPGAWWLWALALALAASRTTNPFLLLLIVTVAGIVVYRRRPDAPWARSFSFFLALGALIIVIRVVAQAILGASFGTVLVLDLPSVQLPTFMAGLTLGGPVYLESLLGALYDGMRLATIIACVGAANSLASPTRLLKSVPAALYEVGVAVVVAVSFVPRLVEHVVSTRQTRKLRGRTTRGVRAVAGSAVPVLHGALESSVVLAAAMDSRGYGRRAPVSAMNRRTTSAAVLIGLVCVVIGSYGLLSPGVPAVVAFSFISLGILGSVAGLWWAGKSRTRTVYRPDPWWLPEWLLAASATGVVVAFIYVGNTFPAQLNTSTMPPAIPALPILCLIALLAAATPGWFTPRPPLQLSTPALDQVHA
jgi:energy-coupling factor transport system permease protein